MQMPSTPWSTMQSSTRRWDARSSSPPSVNGVGAIGKMPVRAGVVEVLMQSSATTRDAPRSRPTLHERRTPSARGIRSALPPARAGRAGKPRCPPTAGSGGWHSMLQCGILGSAALVPVPSPQSIPTSVASPFGCDWPPSQGGVWPRAPTKVRMPFTRLGLSDALVRAVTEQGYTVPTPIQAQAIPAVLAGGDLLAGAQTGTGKTAGFVLPILQRLSERPAAGGRRPIRTLIITP